MTLGDILRKQIDGLHDLTNQTEERVNELLTSLQDELDKKASEASQANEDASGNAAEEQTNQE